METANGGKLPAKRKRANCVSYSSPYKQDTRLEAFCKRYFCLATQASDDGTDTITALGRWISPKSERAHLRLHELAHRIPRILRVPKRGSPVYTPTPSVPALWWSLSEKSIVSSYAGYARC